jgi:dipeptidyl aminopeptidase/acylaminoacyl peptidase
MNSPIAAFQRRVVVVLMCVALASAALVGAEPRIVELSDLSLVVDLSDPRMSPDGRWIAVIASRPDYDDNRYQSQLVLVEVSNGTQRPMTWNRHDVRNPRWSPDGSAIGFIAGDSEKRPQVFVLPLDGGEAEQVTEVPTGIVSFEWAPDGKRLAFAGAEKPEEAEGPEKHNRSFEVGGDWYLADKVSPARHLWVVDLEGGEPRRLTTTHTLAYLLGGYSWAPDGRSLVYSGQPDLYSGSFLRSSVRRIDVETGSETVLVGGPAPFVFPTVSPAGDRVAFGRSRGEEPFFNPMSARVVALNGGGSRDVTSGIDRDLGFFGWLPDGGSLLVSAADGTGVSVWVQPLDGQPEKLGLGDVIPNLISISDTGAIAFTGSESSSAPELYVMSSTGGTPRQLTDFNAEVSSRRLGRVETIRWENEGFEEDGVLVYPPDFEEGRRYPLVLSIHGGPMAASTIAFDIRTQLYAARGWLIFSPNYRGSTNLGGAYQHAVVNDAGAGPGRDVMAGVETVKALGIVDEDRIAVSGWSYGGYMTTWLTSHYQGWAAAVAGASVTDWFDWYALSDMNVWSGYGLGGSPWKNGNDQGYREQSPITYAHKIRTPMLILSTTLDPRVSVTQSFKLYSVLRDHEVPVKFIGYPVPGHFPADPVHRRDIYRRWMDWIAEHF